MPKKRSSLTVRGPSAKLLHSNARLRGQSNRSGGTRSPTTPTTDESQQTTPTLSSQARESSTSLTSKLPPLPASPSLSQSMGMMSSSDDPLGAYNLPNPVPLWLNPAYAKHIVKGNFMTLSARPKTVEQGEWIAHQGKQPISASWYDLPKLTWRQWSSTTATFGTSFASSMRKRRTEPQSATPQHAPGCPPEGKPPVISYPGS